MHMHTPINVDINIRQGMYDAADEIGNALIGNSAVSLETIRALQGLLQLARMADLRLKTNALPATFNGPAIIEGEATHA